MPKVKIDYSNTIFYKIYCKDPSIKELYIGHTTNFVQRKYSHKQGCINPKSMNYKCKVYEVIRDNMGWDNWTMEIIAFHNCEDLYSAKKQEQHYFEEYKATLKSVEPLPPRKPKKEVIVKPKKKKEVLYCNSCKVYFTTRKLQEEHNKRPRHLKMEQTEIFENPNIVGKFHCEICNYSCSKQSDFNKHLSTRKHKILINPNTISPEVAKVYTCDCGREYKHMSSLCNHKKKCNNDPINASTTLDNQSLLIELLKQNQEFKDLILEERREFNQILREMAGNMCNSK